MMMPQLPTFSPIYDYCDLIAVVLSARIALKRLYTTVSHDQKRKR